MFIKLIFVTKLRHLFPRDRLISSRMEYIYYVIDTTFTCLKLLSE